MKKVLNLFDFKQQVNYKTEVLAGLTVAMTMIPESLSFAILAGFPPLMGLYASFIAGLVTAIFGGRPGMISGGAGATVIVLIALMKSDGLEYVLAAVALAGVFQIIIGVFKLGNYIRLVPYPVISGFMSGIGGIIIALQVSRLFGHEPAEAGTIPALTSIQQGQQRAQRRDSDSHPCSPSCCYHRSA